MENESSIKTIINQSLEQIRTIIDADTVVGKPIATPSGTVIIPISKVSMGFASGGLDLPTESKTGTKNFGGGGGTGVSVNPIGFLTVYGDGRVEMIPLVQGAPSPIEQVVDILDHAPDIYNRVKSAVQDLFGAGENNEAEEARIAEQLEQEVNEALATPEITEQPLTRKELRDLKKMQKNEAKAARVMAVADMEATKENLAKLQQQEEEAAKRVAELEEEYNRKLAEKQNENAVPVNAIPIQFVPVNIPTDLLNNNVAQQAPAAPVTESPIKVEKPAPVAPAQVKAAGSASKIKKAYKEQLDLELKQISKNFQAEEKLALKKLEEQYNADRERAKVKGNWKRRKLSRNQQEYNVHTLNKKLELKDLKVDYEYNVETTKASLKDRCAIAKQTAKVNNQAALNEALKKLKESKKSKK